MLEVRDRDVLVVGAGPIGTQKARGLHAQGAHVTVVAPEISPEIDAMNGLVLLRRAYRVEDLDRRWLVIAATGDPDLQQRIHDEATERRIWVNCADEPSRCSFILPAVHRQGAVTVSVSTGGASPALAGWLRDLLARALPPDLDGLVTELQLRRAAVKGAGDSTESIAWRPIIEEILRDLEGKR
jgi:siroheme synthase-like protein